MTVEECNTQETGWLVDNGKSADHFLGGPPSGAGCAAGFKLAGALTGVAVAPATPPTFAMTVTSVMHVQVEPWCVYTLAPKFSLPASSGTESEGSIKSVLDKPASFGSCASTRYLHVRLAVVQASFELPYQGEIVG